MKPLTHKERDRNLVQDRLLLMAIYLNFHLYTRKTGQGVEHGLGCLKLICVSTSQESGTIIILGENFFASVYM